MLFKSQAADIIDRSLIEWIHNQDNRERLNLYQENEDYYDGDIDIKLPGNIKAMLSREFGFTGNICRAVVDAAVGFLSKEPLAVEINLPHGEDKEALDEIKTNAESFLYEIFRESDLLTKNFIKALRIQAKKGEFAVKTSRVLDEQGETITGYKISILRPDICFPKWKDEEYNEMEYFAIKYIRTNQETNKKEHFAQVIWPDEVREYTKPLDSGDLSVWTKIDEWRTDYGFIPVEWIKNKEDDRPWGESDITSDLKDIQDALNKSITDLLYNMDKDSYKEKFILGAERPLDSKGKPVDIESGPGKLHFLPAAIDGNNPAIWESTPASFTGLLESIDKILDIVSVISKVPRNELSRSTTTGNAPTGIALKIIYQPFLGKTQEKVNLIKAGLEKICHKLFLMAEKDGLKLDIGEDNDFITVIHIANNLPSDDKLEAEVHEIEQRNRWKSRETIMQERGIEDVEAEKEKIKAEEQEAAIYGDIRRVDEELELGPFNPEPEL